MTFALPLRVWDDQAHVIDGGTVPTVYIARDMRRGTG